jgi:hypothetical protein
MSETNNASEETQEAVVPSASNPSRPNSVHENEQVM